jgi:hypothetical protein
MFLAVINPDARDQPTKPRSSRAGCVLSGLIVVVLLLVIILGGWLFIGRPLAHSIVEQELDKAMSAAVEKIPTQAALLPAGTMLPVQENALNNLIVLNLSPSSPVQQPTTRITPTGIRIEFQVYGQQCAISGVPTVVNGQLTATNVQVEGLLGLILSPEELTAQLNRHLGDAQARLKHSMRSAQLKDHELDLTLGDSTA